MPDIITASVPHFERIADWRGLWLMEATAMHTMREALAAMDWAAHMAGPAPRPTSSTTLIPTKNDKSIAIISASGTLMKSASSMGGTSTVQLRRDISSAANDPSISGILLAIDSPGGTAAGTYELGGAVRRAADTKPTWAFIEDLGASAAYWMASQASQIYAANPMTQVGSIGTYWTIYDTSAMLEKDGVKVHHFATGPLKGAGAYGTPMTEEQAAHFQAQVDQMQTHFDDAVRYGRNMSRNELAAVKTGGVFGAKEAMGLKLIDGIKSLEQVLKSLAQAK